MKLSLIVLFLAKAGATNYMAIQDGCNCQSNSCRRLVDADTYWGSRQPSVAMRPAAGVCNPAAFDTLLIATGCYTIAAEPGKSRLMFMDAGCTQGTPGYSVYVGTAAQCDQAYNAISTYGAANNFAAVLQTVQGMGKPLYSGPFGLCISPTLSYADAGSPCYAEMHTMNDFVFLGAGDDQLINSNPEAAALPKATCGVNDDKPCFPSSATVALSNGTKVRIDALKEGDAIVAATADGTMTTDTVSLLSIAEPDKSAASYISLVTEANTSLIVTAGHHLPVGPSCCSTLKLAKDVQKGDTVWADAGRAPWMPWRPKPTTIIATSATTKASGLHSPVLTHGSFPVVNGFVTAFDSIEKVTLAKHGLAPLLSACKATGTCDKFRKMFLTEAL